MNESLDDNCSSRTFGDECTIIDTSECCGEPEVKFNCNRTYTSVGSTPDGEYKTATKTEYGTGSTKQEACEAALLNAKISSRQLLLYMGAFLTYLRPNGISHFHRPDSESYYFQPL